MSVPGRWCPLLHFYIGVYDAVTCGSVTLSLAAGAETVNGRITVHAWIHRGIRPNCVFVPIGWDEQQPYHPSSSVNHLTSIRLDPISQLANLKTHLCRVGKDTH